MAEQPRADGERGQLGDEQEPERRDRADVGLEAPAGEHGKGAHPEREMQSEGTGEVTLEERA